MNGVFLPRQELPREWNHEVRTFNPGEFANVTLASMHMMPIAHT